ncbi:MAG: ABC transporter ATP-binding protein [Gemmatimonadales bacterium]
MAGTGSVVARLLGAFRADLVRQRWLLAGSFAALGAEIAFKSLEPWPLKLVVDQLLAPGAARPLGLDPGTLVVLAGVGLVLAVALRATATYLNTLGFSLAGNRLLAAVRLRLVEHLQRLSLGFHGRTRSGDLVQRLSRDVDLLKEVLVTALLPLLGNIGTLVVLVAVMWWMDWRLAAVALLVLPVFGLLARRLVPRIHDAARKQRQREGASAAALTETLGAMRVVQAMALEDRLTRTIAKQERATVEADVRGRVLAARLERSVDILTAMASALVLVAGARLARTGAITAGDLIVFLSYLKSAYKPMQDLAKYLGRLAKASAAGERILETLDAVPEVADRPDAVEAPPLAGRLELREVRFGYDESRPVLDGASLVVEPAESVALMGPSGQGKSTLASLLLRLYDPAGGAVLVDGRDLRDYRVASVRRQISIVPQDSLLFGVSVRENIRHGNPAATDAEIAAAAHLVRAHEFITALPQGYDTILGERGGTLSSGQRQRIALARAAVKRAPILILDEPTTGLDESNRRAVADAIAELARGRTTLIITHDDALAGRADRIVQLDGGRIREGIDALA